MVESAADDSSLFDSLLGQTPLAVRFAWLSTVGQGRAGAVFKVRDRERNGEIVALKILADRGAFDENTVVRFMQEIKACREIRHPNLVRAHDLVRAGQVLGFDAKEGWPGWDVVDAYLPQSEMNDLIIEIRSQTMGVGFFTWGFDHLQELEGRDAEKIVEARKKALEHN